jgi:hypothetical protein
MSKYLRTTWHFVRNDIFQRGKTTPLAAAPRFVQMLRFCVFLALPSQLLAFEFFRTADGTPCRWDLSTLPAKTISWRLSEGSPEILRESTRFACLNWTVASAGTIQFAEGDGGVLITWAAPEIPDGTPAQTVLTTRSAAIVGAEITLNTKSFAWKRTTGSTKTAGDTREELDLDAIILHEMGHVLGLHHSDENTAATVGTTNNFDLPTMNSIVHPTARTLHLDDISGLRQLYGITAPLPQLFAEASPAVGKAPLKVALFQTGGDADTMWDLGNGSITMGENAAVRYKTPGFYTVTAESNGMTATVIVEVTKKKIKKPKKSRQVLVP